MQLMGRASTKKAEMKFESGSKPSAQLYWLEIRKGLQPGGDLLVAFEVYMVSGAYFMFSISKILMSIFFLER